MKAAFVLAVRYLFFTRYSWLTGVALVLLAPWALGSFPGLLANLFVLDHPAQVFHVSWITMWCAITVLETLRVTTMHAHLRFDDYRTAVDQFRLVWKISPPVEDKDWYRTLPGWVLVILGFGAATAVWHLVLDACVTRTSADPAVTWQVALDAADGTTVHSLAWRKAWAGWMTSVVLAAVLSCLFILLRERISQRPSTDQPPHWPETCYPRLHQWLGPGYFEQQTSHDGQRPPRWHLAAGHLRLWLYATPFVAWYVVNYVTAFGEAPMPTETSPYPALFYGLLSLLLLAYLLPALAFYCDRYRVPVSLLVGGVILASYSFFDTDHYYELDPPAIAPATTQQAAADAAAAPPGEAGPVPTLEQVFDNWSLPRDKEGKRTLVVVDASGGGIQASAWTAQVLTGLHESYGNSFTRSIGLISSVSGGSVGTMYYLAYRAELDPQVDLSSGTDVLPVDVVRQIRHASRASALEATAWGLAYPDTIRVLLPPAMKKTIDRGWAIEQVWRQRLGDGPVSSVDRTDLRLTTLGEASVDRQLPIPVFNATLMESGQRLQISPVLSPPGPGTGASTAAVELLRLFPDARLHVATAARLSATFPYVTPAARADGPGNAPQANYHVVDGAYVDNEGVVTSVDWINRLLLYYSQEDKLLTRPFDRVLLVRIQAFPQDLEDSSAGFPAASSGWRSAMLGPLDAMMKVRGTSQIERGDLEISLLTKATQATLEATRERYQSDWKAAQAVVDMLREAEPERSVPLIAPRGLSPSDLAREQSAAADELRLAELTRDSTEQLLEAVEELQVTSVLFDFRPPDGVLIPLSWKLTESQKQNIDRAWDELVQDKHPRRPLTQLDPFFSRVERRP